MKTICITGYDHYLLQETAQILFKSGLTEANPVKHDRNLDIHTWHTCVLKQLNSRSINSESINIGRLWEQLAADIFISNIELPAWGWVNAKSSSLMDFWLDFDTNINLILSCVNPMTALTSAINNTDDHRTPDQILEDWYNQHHKMLHFNLRNADRSILVDGEKVKRYPNLFIKSFQEKWNIILDKKNIQLKDTGNDNFSKNTFAEYLASEILKNNPAIISLQQEIDSCLLPLHDCSQHSALNTPSTSDVINEYRRLQRQKSQLLETEKSFSDLSNTNHSLNQQVFNLKTELATANNSLKGQIQISEEASSQLNQLKQKSTELALQLDALKREKTAIQEQAESLLLQLHQSQEDVERLYLQEKNAFQQIHELQKQLEKGAQTNESLQTELKKYQDAAKANAAELVVALHAHATLQTEIKIALQTREELELELKKHKETAEKIADEYYEVKQERNKLQSQLFDLRENSELLLHQLHQTQEELEKYFLRHQQAQKLADIYEARWKRILKRNPKYFDFENVYAQASHKNSIIKWKIDGINSAARNIDLLEFETLLIEESAAFRFTKNISGDNIFTRWPSRNNESFVISPLHKDDELTNLSTSDAQLLDCLASGLSKILEEPFEINISEATEINYLKEALKNWSNQISLLPPVIRFDKINLKNNQTNPDYEHLWFIVENLSFGSKTWDFFEFRIACSNVSPVHFGSHPKIEIPQAKSGTPITSWFEESIDDYGSKLEIRFALPNDFDINIWNKINLSDQFFLKSLLATTPKFISYLEEKNTKISRDWQDWHLLTKNINLILDKQNNSSQITDSI